LRAWRQGDFFLINNYATIYKVSEGTVVYVDDHERTLNVWYEGNSWTIDENNMELPFSSLQLSYKTVAWQTPDYQFKLFIDGTIINKPIYTDNLFYATGAGFCVLINPNSQYFEKLTLNGIYDLELFPVKWWEIRYNKLIYLTRDNDLKVVINDLTTVIGNHKPDKLAITIFGVFYNRLQHLYYFEKQMEHIVIDYIPNYYYIYNRIFIYRDILGNVQVWDNGIEYTPALSPAAKIEPMSDVIVITDANKTFFWHKGRIYGDS